MFVDEFGEFLVRMIIAAVLGGLIGFERDLHGRSAGLRTHLLVSLGAAIFTILSEVMSRKVTGGTVPADPGRIAAQIVTGIGFLGAGVILKEGLNVRGLTTAACLWLAAAIGMAAGSGTHDVAIAATGLGMIGLVVLKRIERLYPKDSYRMLTIVAPIDVDTTKIIDLVKDEKLKILNCDIAKNYETGRLVAQLSIRLFHRGVIDKLAHGIIESLEASSLKLLEVKWDHT